MNSFKNLTLGLSILTMLGCATDQAAKVREARPLTVGFIGASYRPSDKVGLNLSVGLPGAKESFKIDKDEKVKTSFENCDSECKDTKNQERDIESTEHAKVDLALHYYIWDTSAFFLGGGVEYRKQRTEFGSATTRDTPSNPQYTNVSFDDELLSIGPSFGWDWIWENGFSISADFGPRWAVQKQRKFREDGSHAQVNEERRDAILRRLDQSKGLEIIRGRGVIGYSF
jgi:hypothetical protein